ncbi:MAG: type II secretion system protein GspE, partial [Candidatus Margulisiibacteriota bacterium]
MPNERKSLGEILVEKKVISKAQLGQAQKESEKTGETLRKVLIRLNLVKEQDIISFFEQQLHIPYIDLANYIVDPKILSLVPEAFAKEHQIITLFKTGNIVTVAMVDPLNVMVLDEIRAKTGCMIEPVVAGESEIKKALNQYFGIGSSIDDVVKTISADKIDVQKTASEEELSPEEMRLAAEKAPIVKLVNLIIMEAIRGGASDVHIEPEE